MSKKSFEHLYVGYIKCFYYYYFFKLNLLLIL